MSLCCKCGGIFGNQPLKITKWGHFKDSKWSWHKIETFLGARDFFGPIKWHERQRGPFLGPKKSNSNSCMFIENKIYGQNNIDKVKTTSKSQDFVQGTI